MRKLLWLVVGVMLGALWAAPTASAVCTACVDASFGTGGFTYTQPSGLNGEGYPANAVASDAFVDSDGRVVVYGLADDGPTLDRKDAFVARLDSDGDLDTSFGGGDGMVSVDVAGLGHEDWAYAAAELPDGRLVLTGDSHYNGGAMFLLQLQEDGDIDTTFGGGDGVILLAQTYMPREARVLADGTIVVVAWTRTTPKNAVMHFTPAGALDTNFDGDGIVIPAGDTGGAQEAVINANGSVVYVFSNGSTTTVRRLTAAGGLDATFDGDGTKVFAGVHSTSIAVGPDGSMVVAGYSEDVNFHTGMSAVKLTSTGASASSWGTVGQVYIEDPDLQQNFADVIVQSDGAVILLGVEWGDVGERQHIIRVSPAGSIDTSFGNAGDQVLQTGQADEARSIVDLGGGAFATVADSYRGDASLFRNPVVYGFAPGGTADTTTPAVPTAVIDGSGPADIDIPGNKTMFEIDWASSTDNVGIAGYDWCLSATADCASPLRSSSTIATEAPDQYWNDGFDMPDGTYFACVRARDTSYNLSAYVCTDGFTVGAADATPPTDPPNVFDGTVTDADFVNSTAETHVTWDDADDAGSGIQNYDWCVATAADNCVSQVRTGTTADASTTTDTGALPSLVNGSSYYSCVRARDNADNVSGWECSDGFQVDTGAPVAPGEVRDGAGVDIDVTASRAAAKANWDAGADMGSGISGYDWCINNAADCSTANRAGTLGAVASVTTAATPALADGTYYACVRSTDNAGNHSSYECSDGFVVQGPVTVGNLRMTRRTRTTISTAWNTVTCLTGAKTFRLRERRGSGSWHWEFAATNRLSWRSSNLRANTSYSYQVYAYCGGVQRGVSATKTYKTVR